MHLFLNITGSLAVMAILIFIFRDGIRKRLQRWQVKLQLGTLRTAIHEADDNKKETGRKNMVIFNSTEKKFEPVQKKQLKQISKAGKNRSNKSLTHGRKRRKRIVNGRVLSVDRVKTIEKKSLYVTE